MEKAMTDHLRDGIKSVYQTQKNGGNKEREAATAVVIDCCLRRRIWLIDVHATRKGILGPIGNARYKRAITAQGRYSPARASWPEEGICGPKGISGAQEGSLDLKGYARKGILPQSSVILYPKGHSWLKRALVARNEHLSSIILMMVSDRQLSMWLELFVWKIASNDMWN